jgi:hypothetical protein
LARSEKSVRAFVFLDADGGVTRRKSNQWEINVRTRKAFEKCHKLARGGNRPVLAVPPKSKRGSKKK